MPNLRLMPLLALLLLLTLVSPAVGPQPVAATGSPEAPRFAFWYEDWQSNTWDKLQPANVIIGVPPKAVAEIHAHGGRALAYVTFYQAVLGREFIHDRADLEVVGFHIASGFLPSAFGGKDNYVLCSNSAVLRQRILAYLDRTLGAEGYDGLFVDNSYIAPAAGLVCDAKHQHVTPSSKGGPAYIDLMSEVYAAVKKRNRAAIIITNPGNPRWADQLQAGNKSLWDVSDFVLWESYGYSSQLGKEHDRWQATIAQSKDLSSLSHGQKLLALAYPRDPKEALYSFAIAQTFGFRFAANLGESDYQGTRDGGHFGIFLHDLPVALGAPVSVSRQPVAGVMTRQFSQGEVAVNTGSAAWSFKALRNSVLYSPAGNSELTAGREVMVSPGTAVALLFR
jgi:hypothetical protein